MTKQREPSPQNGQVLAGCYHGTALKDMCYQENDMLECLHSSTARKDACTASHHSCPALNDMCKQVVTDALPRTRDANERSRPNCTSRSKKDLSMHVRASSGAGYALQEYFRIGTPWATANYINLSQWASLCPPCTSKQPSGSRSCHTWRHHSPIQPCEMLHELPEPLPEAGRARTWCQKPCWLRLKNTSLRNPWRHPFPPEIPHFHFDLVPAVLVGAPCH